MRMQNRPFDERDERFRREDIRTNILKRIAELRVDWEHIESGVQAIDKCVEII